MSMPAISAYLTRSSHDGLNEVIQVFRHDFVQYLGMILSWVTLIEGEANAAPDADPAFKAAAAQLQANTERAFNTASARLRPIVPADGDVSQLNGFWDTFFTEFKASAVPALDALETQTRALVGQPAFATVIESGLGMVAEGDSIGGLLLRPFERLRAMLQPEAFDARVAEVVASRRSSDTTPDA
jgi:hypothetical protein